MLKVENCFVPQRLTLLNSSEESKRIRASVRRAKFPIQTLDFIAILFWPGWRVWGDRKVFVLWRLNNATLSSSVSSDPLGKIVPQTQVQKGQKDLFNPHWLFGLLNSNFYFWIFPKELGQIELIEFSRLLWFPSSRIDLAPVILNFWDFIFVKKIG